MCRHITCKLTQQSAYSFQWVWLCAKGGNQRTISTIEERGITLKQELFWSLLMN